MLVAGVAASALSSAATGRLSARISQGWLLVLGTMTVSAALALESLAPALWVIAVGSAVFGLGFGTIDTALNVYATRHFSARNITWMHAGYGLGAMLGPLLVTMLLTGGGSARHAPARPPRRRRHLRRLPVRGRDAGRSARRLPGVGREPSPPCRWVRC